MTDYTTYENSVASGAPVELFDIYDIDGTHYRMTTSEDEVTYAGHVYSKAIVKRSNIILTGDAYFDGITVELSRGHPLATRFISEPVDGEVQLVIYRQHDIYTKTYWSGFLTAVTFNEEGVPILRFDPRTSDTPGAGARRRSQKLCDHALYRIGCNVNRESYRVDSVITNISGNAVTGTNFSSYSDGWFQGGILVWNNVERLITAHVTNTVTLDRYIPDAQITDVVRAYPGCDHTPSTCLSKFSNKYNYGGCEHLPVKNPFAGGSIMG